MGVLEMVRPKLDAHYSVLGLISRVACCLGLSLLLWFVAAHLIRQNWFAIANYVAAPVPAGAALAFSYRLLTARGQVVVSVDATGFKDTRLTPAVIPWSVIQSVSPYIPYRSRKATGVDLAPGLQAKSVDPAGCQALCLGKPVFRVSRSFEHQHFGRRLR